SPKQNELAAGQSVEIFSPEPFTGSAEALTRTTYVKIGKTDATVVNAGPAASPAVDKLVLHGDKFSPGVVGGVACDQFGNTVGIVDSIEQVSAAALIARGWQNDQVKELIKDPIGIFLTMVAPQTPAAFARLKAGDVIVSVNQEQVKSADEFSDLLVKAGSGEQVQFTVRRPGTAAPLEIPVTLGSSFAPTNQWGWGFSFPQPPAPLFRLEGWGLHTLGWT